MSEFDPTLPVTSPPCQTTSRDHERLRVFVRLYCWFGLGGGYSFMRLSRSTVASVMARFIAIWMRPGANASMARTLASSILIETSIRPPPPHTPTSS